MNSNLFAQRTGILAGMVQNMNTSQQLANVTIAVNDSLVSTKSDSAGKFRISLPVGSYKVVANIIGFTSVTKYNIVVSTGNIQNISFELSPASNDLGEVSVNFSKGKSAVAADMVTPLSVQQLTTEEIRSNPGGNFDVSRVIQTLPGVGISNGVGERNDVIVRGGAPNENVYYLDGIEIPLLNHFQTQGSSGGAQGILNVSFIESLKLSSSAFDARYDNPLASTFVIKQREGNSERISGNIRASLTESVATLEGPIGKKTTFLSSARRSYLGLLFSLIDLPIRPDFYDFQYKIVHKFNPKTTLTAIGLGAIDRFRFAATKESTPENIYTLRSTPYINQWSYTAGFNLNHKITNGYMNFSLSRNVFDNRLDKYEDDLQDESKRSLYVSSQETENKFRFDINRFVNGWRLSTGVMLQYVQYTSDLFNKISAQLNDENGNLIRPERAIIFNSDLSFWKYGLFLQVSKNLLNEKLLVSGGIRSDMNTFTNDGDNPLKTISPRLSLAYHLSNQWDINASIGSYFKIPTYTALGYKDVSGSFSNQDMKYIRSYHYVLGTQFLPKNDLRFTLEGFYKRYSNYPVSVINGISLANQGSEYGSVGSEALLSIGKGETYGIEAFMQQKLTGKLFYVVSYSWIRSKFAGLNGELLPSSWDSQHLLSLTAGYKLRANWDLGIKYRYAGGTPYTPFDLNSSQQNYITLGTGVLDYNQLNSQRLSAYSQLDLRIDKRINFKRTSLNLYADIQNILKNQNANLPKYTFKRNDDNSGFATTDGLALKADGSNGKPTILDTQSGNIIPSLGLVFEF